MSWRESDSRDYIIPFSILRKSDLPSDFTLPPEVPREFTGIFLPQERASFAARSPTPYVILLADDTIRILTQRSTEHTTISLARLQVLECGRILLRGWIGLQWEGGSQTVRYNRRSAPTVERFLSKLKASWLKRGGLSAHPHSQTFGPEPTLKFYHTVSTEIFADEAPLLQFFQPPACTTRRRFGLRREVRKAGDLLMLSDRRLLWITDRRQTTPEQYGTVAQSTVVGMLKEVRVNESQSGPAMEIGLRSGTVWRVPVAEAWQDAAKAFAGKVGCAVQAWNGSVEAGRR